MSILYQVLSKRYKRLTWREREFSGIGMIIVLAIVSVFLCDPNLVAQPCS